MANEEKTWNMLCHLAALAGFIGIPFGNIIGPLVVWLVQKEKYPSVDAYGKEAVNFQISMTIYTIVAFLTVFILVGFLLLPALIVANVILIIIASVKANQGEFYAYPFSIRFIK